MSGPSPTELFLVTWCPGDPCDFCHCSWSSRDAFNFKVDPVTGLGFDPPQLDVARTFCLPDRLVVDAPPAYYFGVPAWSDEVGPDTVPGSSVTGEIYASIGGSYQSATPFTSPPAMPAGHFSVTLNGEPLYDFPDAGAGALSLFSSSNTPGDFYYSPYPIEIYQWIWSARVTWTLSCIALDPLLDEIDPGFNCVLPFPYTFDVSPDADPLPNVLLLGVEPVPIYTDTTAPVDDRGPTAQLVNRGGWTQAPFGNFFYHTRPIALPTPPTP
jgi:hypothetical protein